MCPSTAFAAPSVRVLAARITFDHRLIPQASDVIGGLYSVRGYPQNEAGGDSVYIASAEYRFHLPRVLPIRREAAQLPWLGSFRFVPQQVYGRTDWDLVFSAFVDFGQTIRNRKDLGFLETDSQMLGVGLGVELRLKQNFRARLDWGHALFTTYELVPVQNPAPPPEYVPLGVVATPKGNDEIYLQFSVLF